MTKNTNSRHLPRLISGMWMLNFSGVIGLIEGIIYLTKTDEEFYNIYVANKKAWF